MDLLLVDNAHIYKDISGNYYSKTIYNNEFFDRYLKVFTKVTFVCKTLQIEVADSSFSLINTDKVSVLEIPYYKGLSGLLKNFFQIINRLWKINKNYDLTIFRMAQIESIIVYWLSARRKDFAIELVNDPKSFSDINPLIKLLIVKTLKRMINKTIAISYVTSTYLQKKYYSSKKGTIIGSYSSVEIRNSDIKSVKSICDYTEKKTYNLVHVANNINSYAKGHKTAIDTIKMLRDSGYRVTLDFFGDGDMVNIFEKYAKSIGVEKCIAFRGRVKNSKELINQLTNYDIFFFPSKYEGLPRVVIEAQAACLPCVASNVGGITELIETTFTTHSKNVEGFYRIISGLINNPHEIVNQSMLSKKSAQRFLKSDMEQKRTHFYTTILKKITTRGEAK